MDTIEGRIQALVSMILMVTLCATILLQPGLADVQVTPQFTSFPGSPIDLTKCWSSLFSVEDCVIDIYKFSVTGKFGINQACCKAFMDMDDKCWRKMIPFNPFFRPLLKNSCSRRIQALVSMILMVTLCATILLQPGLADVQVTPQFTSFPGSPIDLTKCWSSLFSVEDCVIDIYKFSVTGKFGINQACCKAFMDMDDKCWRKMIPFNPFFRPLLKNSCSRRIQALVSMILMVTLCATILLQPGLADVQVTPQFTSFPGSPIDLTKCWSSLFSVEDCVIDIYKFSVTGKFGINQACCKAFMDMDDKCWRKMIPFNPFFRPLLKNSCSLFIYIFIRILNFTFQKPYYSSTLYPKSRLVNPRKFAFRLTASSYSDPIAVSHRSNFPIEERTNALVSPPYEAFASCTSKTTFEDG
ncbi:hypothetical protein HID58_062230 [Brassica napus]|uniref:Prolamin-like domain-containing protein n=1 Tax=Brassica napus TaxID=3708 RepID=A0ABQ8A0W9_BRANA|nr:hypothetical protein HID58_062230 [Brassica napus]